MIFLFFLQSADFCRQLAEQNSFDRTTFFPPSRHYKQAYSHILEIKLTDINNLEVKVVAGFLNYKVSQICWHFTTFVG